MPDPLQSERGQSPRAGTQYPGGVMASRSGGHRGRRPGHVDQGMARELGRASSASCLENAEQGRGNPLRESTAIPKLPHGKARHSAGSIHFENAEMTGARGRASTAKEPGMGVRQS